MSKSTCHSRLSSTATTPEVDISNIQLQNLMDFRSQVSPNDKRFNNITYVRHVLRRLFGSYGKKSSSINSPGFDESITDQSPNDVISPILIHSCLSLNKQAKFSGELLLDWFLIHFEGRYENIPIVKQVILQCCTCLLGLDVLKVEKGQENDLFQVQNFYSWTNTNTVEFFPSAVNPDIHHLIDSKEYKYKPSTATTILDILRSEYEFQSDIQQIETNSISLQVNLTDEIEKIDKSIQTDSSLLKKCLIEQMSSFTDSNNDPSLVDENTLRSNRHKLFLHDNLNDPSSPGEEDDIRSPLSSPQAFKNDHAKYTSELLLEWITLNSDSRNSNTHAVIQDVKSPLHSNEKTSYKPLNVSDSTNLPHSFDNKSFFLTSKHPIMDDVHSLLSDLVTEVDKRSNEILPFTSTITSSPILPPPPPLFCLIPSPSSTTMNANIPPPPPPMMLGFGVPPPLPHYLCKKQKYPVTEPVKKIQWSKINPYTIKKDSMWVNVDEAKYVNDTLFSDIQKNFASKIVSSRQPIHDLVDKSKELRVLDAKAAQNFAIMFSQLKVSPFVFREWMLSCDNENLKYDFLKQLEKYLPTSDELKTLAEYKNELNDLQYSEQYFCAIGDIKRLKQRLKTLLFKANYKETIEETDKAFVEVRSACDHVRHSSRFKKMLELILTVGNYMNSSAKTYEPIYGFDISFLPKLHSTKANDGRRSLLHFIVQAIEDKHQDLLSFSDEFYLLADGVSKINILELQKQPQEINRELKNAREELAIGEEQIEGDRFAVAIQDFIIRADDDVARLEQLDEEMRNAYQDLCDFLAMDMKNYSLTEFFTDLKLFCTFFSTCLQEIRVWREQAARAAKTTNIQLLAEKKTLDIPDDLLRISRRTSSRAEDLLDKRKTNRGLTPTIKRSQS